MADDKTQLTWVQQPTVVDGAVSYAYSNSGGAAATFVSEMINVLPTDGSPNQVQSYQLEHLDINAVQQTHAPVSADLANGAVQIFVSIQASSDQKEWDATIEGQTTGVMSGGVLYASDAAPATAGSLTIEIQSFELQGADAVAHYRVTGEAVLQLLTGSVSLTKGSGAPPWMTVPRMEGDREDIVRVAVPLNEVVDDEDGWQLRIAIGASGGPSGPESFVEAVLPLRKTDGAVVADGQYSVTGS
jgi:hypothetical protein